MEYNVQLEVAVFHLIFERYFKGLIATGKPSRLDRNGLLDVDSTA